MAISLFFSVICALGPQAIPATTVSSPDGRFVVQLLKSGMSIERVGEGGARERQWLAKHSCDAETSAHLLSDGGRVLVHVGSRPGAGESLVELHTSAGRTAALDAAALDVPADGGTWIELSPRAMRLGSKAGADGRDRLDLLGRDGRLRTIDLSSGRVDVPRSEHAAVDVTPSALPEGGRLMIVGSWRTPCAVAAGELLPVEVVLLIPKPLPQKPTLDLAGFQVIAREKEAVWELLPLGRPAVSPESQAHEQRAIAKLSGLTPGRHRLYVDGGNGSSGVRPPQEVLVVPGTREVALAASGGFVGQRRRTELWANGVAVDTGLQGERLAVALVPFADWSAVERALAALPGPNELAESVPPSQGADFVRYDLSWSDASGPRHVVRDDGSLAEPLRAVIAALQKLVPPEDSESAGGEKAGNTTRPGGGGGASASASGGGGAAAAAAAVNAGNAPSASNTVQPRSSSSTPRSETQAEQLAAVQPAPTASAQPASTSPGPAAQIAAEQATQTPPASKVPRWAIDPKASRLAVYTKSGGLFSAFGHDHTLDARTFSGFVELDPSKLAEARLELSVDARSLAVTNKESKDDAAEIEENTRSKVLESERFPAISFTSTKVEAKPLGGKGNAWKVTLTGDLAMHGKTRSLVVPGSFTIEDGVLHALGELEFDLSDWKIKPPSAAGGTVKVADRVKLSFDIVARKPK